jgi:HTH-type transcriptional regulator / antitoxin HigA
MSYSAYDELYEAMQVGLEKRSHVRGRGAVQRAEIRLAIAWRYRNRLPLGNVTVLPVTYWRWHWPRFESEVQYQELRYTLALCPPSGRAEEMRRAFQEERARRGRHIEIDPALFRYCCDGRFDLDGELFGGDPGVALANSAWIAKLWAFERYEFFIEGRFPRYAKDFAICERLNMTTITNKQQYHTAMAEIESFLQKGFANLSKMEENRLQRLSEAVEVWELQARPMPLQPSFADILVYLMQNKRYSQSELSENLSVSKSLLSEILNGKKKPNLDIVVAIHKRFGIDANVLLDSVEVARKPVI